MAQLRQHTDTLDKLRCNVVLISFGTVPDAIKWVEETGAPFELLLDSDRTAYRAYGLGHSLSRSWAPKVWFNYAKLILSGHKWRGIQGDSAQLGGDFIVDRHGIIRLAYRSHDPTDRPSISRLLATLETVRDEVGYPQDV